MFALVAGISLALMSGGRTPRIGFERNDVIRKVVTHAVFFALIGLVLTVLGTPVLVILTYFVVFYVMAIPLLGISARDLAIVAGTWAIFGSIALYGLREQFDGCLLVRAFVVSGDCPALTWMPLLIAGMALERTDMCSRLVHRPMMWAGAGISLVAYGGSAVALSAGMRDTIFSSVSNSIDRQVFVAQRYAQLIHAKTEVAPTEIWA